MVLSKPKILQDIDVINYFAFREDSARRKKKKELREKILKIETLINDTACTEGERQSAILRLKKLKERQMEL